MNPQDFLNLAQILATGTPNPSKLRTATSRAYYAAHHIGAKTLREMNFKIKESGSGHFDVWSKLQNSNHEELIVAGSQLADLHSSRLKADYRLNDARTENQDTVRGHVIQARKIIETIERSCSGSQRQDILNAIKEWEAKTGQ